MLSVRALSPQEQEQLHKLLDHAQVSVQRRARAVLLSAEGYGANEMVPLVNLTAKSIRKWLRRFNEEGVPGLLHERTSTGRPPRLTPQQCQRIVELAKTPSHALDKPFSTWSLAKLQDHLTGEAITLSRSWLWHRLKQAGLSLQRSKKWIQSPDPDYALKKTHRRARRPAPGRQRGDLLRREVDDEGEAVRGLPLTAPLTAATGAVSV